jgi:hypothetical protein
VKKPVRLANGRAFSTQGEALKFFSEMLNRYRPGRLKDRIRISEQDQEDVAALLERYDECRVDRVSKIGVGIDYVFVRFNQTEHFTTPGFWVHRVDGTETDFSYVYAVKGEVKSDLVRYLDACRDAVAQDLKLAKQKHFERYGDDKGCVPCEITGELITIDQAHLDHAWPSFMQIAQSFRAARGWFPDIPEDVLTPSIDGNITTEFKDMEMKEAFRQFHHHVAILRIVTPQANTSLGVKQRRPKIKNSVDVLPDELPF